jgi:hypothetical protein
MTPCILPDHSGIKLQSTAKQTTENIHTYGDWTTHCWMTHIDHWRNKGWNIKVPRI